MNEALNKAKKWLEELGIRTEQAQSTLKVNRDDIDNLFGIGVIYDEVLKEIRSGINYSRLCWTGKDREWLTLETL